MGKYPPSRLKDKYSDWHWQDGRFNRSAFLTDVDRIWVEIRDENLFLTWKNIKFLAANKTYFFYFHYSITSTNYIILGERRQL